MTLKAISLVKWKKNEQKKFVIKKKIKVLCDDVKLETIFSMELRLNWCKKSEGISLDN